MLKKILVLVFSIAVYFAANSQDIIILRSNVNIKVRVIEVGLTEIKYKKFDNPDGPVYSILKDEVFMINYENGSSDIFPQPKEAKKDTVKFVYPESNKPPTKAMLYGTLSIPIGSFGEPQEGAAETGWGIGLITTAPIKNRPAYFHFQLSYTIHPYNSGITTTTGYHEVTGNYHLWHLLLGLGARTKSPDFGGYLNLLAGVNYTTVNGVLEDAGFSDAFAFSISAGAGMILVSNFSIGVKYLYSKPSFTNIHSVYYTADQKISCLQVVGGFEF